MIHLRKPHLLDGRKGGGSVGHLSPYGEMGLWMNGVLGKIETDILYGNMVGK
jgi:hypothetical protein